MKLHSYLIVLSLLLGCAKAPDPAHLTLQLDGVSEALVQIIQGQTLFLNGTVKGSQTLDLPAGKYTVVGLHQEGYKQPARQDITLAAGASQTVTLTYISDQPPANPAHLTLQVEGVAEAQVLVSKGSATVFSGSVQGSAVVDLEAGTYTVDGLPIAGYQDPQAQEVTLAVGERKTLPLTYSPGPPPPPPAGISILAPGDSITQPSFEIGVRVDNPGEYMQMQALFTDKGIVASWSVVPQQSSYTTTVTLNPEQYNGPHTLLIRAQKLDNGWIDGPSKPLTMQVDWNSAAYVEFGGFPANPAFEQDPNKDQAVSLVGEMTSRNGWSDQVILSVSAPAGFSASLEPAQTFLGGSEKKPLSIHLTIPKTAAVGSYSLQIAARDQWDIRHPPVYALSFRVFKKAMPPVVSLSLPGDPILTRPLKITALVSDDDMSGGKVEFFRDGATTPAFTATAAPYEWTWALGLNNNGPHTFKAVATDSMGLKGESPVLTREVKIPFGIRSTLDLGATPTAGPLEYGGFIYLGAGNSVVRINPADLSKKTRSFAPETVKALLSEGGKLYAATTAKVYELEAELLAANPVWIPSGGAFCCLEGESGGFAAYGSVVRGIGSGWQQDLGEAIRALAVSGSEVYLATDTRLLHYSTNSGAIQQFSHASGVKGLEPAFNYLWVLSNEQLERYPLNLTPYPFNQNPLADPETLDGAGWERSEVSVSPDTALAPDGRKVADRLTITQPLHSLRQVVAVQPGQTYTFSFFAKNNGGTAAAYSIYDISKAADLVPTTSYMGQLSAKWSQISVSFTVPADTTEVALYPLRDSGDGVSLLIWGVRLDAGAAPPLEVPLVAQKLCGAPTGMKLLTDLWISDNGSSNGNKGCLTRVNADGVTQPYKASSPPGLAFPPTADGLRLYLGQTNGTLFAIDGTGALLKQEQPSSETPVLGLVVQDRLFVPYSSGKLRVMDKLP